MIISFTLKNFRSIKDQLTLSLEAGSGKSKPDNYTEVESRGGPIRLLRSAIIFGPNASGKSNLLKGIHALQWLVEHSAELKVGDPMPHYEPFRLRAPSAHSPIGFEIEFLLEKIRYRYELSYSQTEICTEKMTYFPEGKTSLLFERNKPQTEVDEIRLGGSVKNKPKNRQVFSNQLFLSRFGQIEPHPLFTQLYKFFQEMNIWNAADSAGMNRLKQEVIQAFSQHAPGSPDWQRLNQLIRSADTGIHEMYIKEAQEHEFQLPAFLSQEVKDKLIQENRTKTFSRHPRFEGEQMVGYEEFELKEESVGTQVLFALGGCMLQTLKIGGILFFDEFDNSLHPTLAKFLIRLFLSSVSNPHNAQLIVASHEVGLISKEMFRKDQIWFTQKNKKGETELYSADDFEGIRDNSAFDRLYLSGTFQAIPHLKTADFLYESPTP